MIMVASPGTRGWQVRHSPWAQTAKGRNFFEKKILILLKICEKKYLPVTSASCERAFSKMKIIKNYLRSAIGQERLTNLSILSIEFDVTNSLSFDDVIDKFSSLKARKIKF